MTVPSLSEVERWHRVMSDPNATAEQIEQARQLRKQGIRELGNATNCPSCEGKGTWNLYTAVDRDWSKTVACPDCGGTGDPPSYATIGRRLGVSRERIRQIAGKA